MFGLSPHVLGVGRPSILGPACAADLHLKADGFWSADLKDKIVQSAVAKMVSAIGSPPKFITSDRVKRPASKLIPSALDEITLNHPQSTIKPAL
jgi:hypothetical protein